MDEYLKKLLDSLFRMAIYRDTYICGDLQAGHTNANRIRNAHVRGCPMYIVHSIQRISGRH